VAIIKFAGKDIVEVGKEATTGIALPLAGAIAIIFISMAVYEYTKRRK
jgi:heme/copper-type cytochrome/quinol oxidase subunit 3